MNYYNEFDPKAAAWLRELIKAGHLPEGIVDERSITDIKPSELTGYTQCHFFAGIGGWSLALQLAGWPADRPVWTGSCPCQPFSAAGKHKGTDDERHLWPVFANLIAECRPPVVFGEQVPSAIGHQWLDGVCADMEKENYAVGAVVLGACAVGAPHRRQRLYWVAENILEDTARIGRRGGSDGVSGGSQRAHEAAGHGDVRDDRAWRRVVFAGECLYEEWDTDRECPTCPVCGGEYGGWGARNECSCPGPSEDTDYEYQTRGELLYARKLGNSDSTRQCKQCGTSAVEAQQQTTECRSAWSNHTTIACRDGKTRRIPVEPAFQPLAHGIPARVVRLRGYGNAIVPQVAAEFIKAWEAIT